MMINNIFSREGKITRPDETQSAVSLSRYNQYHFQKKKHFLNKN